MSRKTRKPQLATLAPHPEAPILSIPNAAHYLGVHILSIRKAIQRGELPFVKVGRGFYLYKTDLLAWVDSLKQQKTVAA